ncbi:hypothetical protein HG535_0G04310 [Zygotorulaspora mrakii]|uniref:DNA polymerase epsilon subunit D n=1 Tax=Zygotorulaspora mrakii TaxID=42260 RepID=A0A7H9B738_ZYGMR|nr:uncharacterized protein HG535_0G04310 [Zygotorulaspora mrakii]QLG74548.1 hypothetical protein HG535_0G04310 [Zygotorulaspora mrakii]
MPPKGWRKDAQGNYPTTSYIKEQENITIRDLLFPKSVIMQLAKEANGDETKKILINKDVSLALQRSATVFVNHLLMFAREFAKNQDRKSCNINDVYDSLDQIGFGGFKSLINNKMIEYQNVIELRKDLKAKSTAEGTNQDDTENEEEEDEEEEAGEEEDREGEKTPSGNGVNDDSATKKSKPNGLNDET